MHWYERLYNEDYLALYEPLVPTSVTREQVHFIENALLLPKGATILDLCCAQGRHAMELAERGYTVVGFDLSQFLLDVARSRAAKRGLDIEFVRGDVRELPYKNTFDGVINYFTSFGYFDDDVENFQVLKRAQEALKPGGKFLIEIANYYYHISHFQPRRWQQYQDFVLLEASEFDWRAGQLVTKQTIMANDGTVRSLPEQSVRTYFVWDLVSMLNKAQMSILSISDGTTGGEFNLERSARLAIVAEKRP